jgi:hypothetical protein
MRMVLAGALLVALPCVALAQPPAASDDKKPADWFEVPADAAAMAPRFKTETMGMLRDGTLTNAAVFDAYWKAYFAQLTHWSKRESLSEMRLKNFKDVLRNKNNDAQKHLVTDLALPTLKKIVQNRKFSPLVRYNALLMLGDLNDTEPDSRGLGAKALPAALPVLAEFLDVKKYPVGDTNDALRVAALVGIQGHVDRGGLAEDQVKLIRPALEALAKQQKAPRGRDPEVHGFMQARAQSVFSALERGAAGRGAAVR